MSLKRVRCFRGQWRRWNACIAPVVTVQANGLLVPPRVDLTLLGYFPGESQRGVFPGAVVEGLMAVVRIIGPLRDIAGVLVVPYGQVLAIALVADRPVEPELVLFDRAAEGAIDVPQFLNFV